MILKMIFMLATFLFLSYELGYCSPPSLLGGTVIAQEEKGAKLDEKYIKKIEKKEEKSGNNRVGGFINQEMTKEKEIRLMGLDLQKVQVEAAIIRARNELNLARQEGNNSSSAISSYAVLEKNDENNAENEVFADDLKVFYIAYSKDYKEALINYNGELQFVNEGQTVNNDIYVEEINAGNVVIITKGKNFTFNLASREK